MIKNIVVCSFPFVKHSLLSSSHTNTYNLLYCLKRTKKKKSNGLSMYATVDTHTLSLSIYGHIYFSNRFMHILRYIHGRSEWIKNKTKKEGLTMKHNIILHSRKLHGPEKDTWIPIFRFFPSKPDIFSEKYTHLENRFSSVYFFLAKHLAPCAQWKESRGEQESFTLLSCLNASDHRVKTLTTTNLPAIYYYPETGIN